LGGLLGVWLFWVRCEGRGGGRGSAPGGTGLALEWVWRWETASAPPSPRSVSPAPAAAPRRRQRRRRGRRDGRDQCHGEQHRTASRPVARRGPQPLEPQTVIEPFRAVTGAAATAARVMMRLMRGMFELLEVVLGGARALDGTSARWRAVPLGVGERALAVGLSRWCLRGSGPCCAGSRRWPCPRRAER
jgi:hypothetical protein